MMKHTVMISILLVALLVPLVAASDYEWIDDFYLNTTAETAAHCDFSYDTNSNQYELSSDCSYRAVMVLNGTSTYDENVAFYHLNGTWKFLPMLPAGDCKAAIMLEQPGPTTWECDFNTTYSNFTRGQFIPFRASTHYDGCGSWTPNPGLTCGDIKEMKVKID